MTKCDCGASKTGYKDEQTFAHSDWCTTKSKIVLNIPTDGSLEELKASIEDAWKQYMKRP